MCGRYRLSRRAEILASYFYAEYEGMDWEARYNIAPTQMVPVIRQDPREPVRRASLMRWGLVPDTTTIPANFVGFDEGYPPGFRAIAVIASGRGDLEQPTNQF